MDHTELITREQQALVDSYYDKLEQVNILKYQLENLEYQLKNEFMEFMKDNGIKKIDTEYLTLTYIPETIRESVDTQKLKDEGLYDYYKKQSVVKEQLRIKEKND